MEPANTKCARRDFRLIDLSLEFYRYFIYFKVDFYIYVCIFPAADYLILSIYRSANSAI